MELPVLGHLFDDRAVLIRLEAHRLHPLPSPSLFFFHFYRLCQALVLPLIGCLSLSFAFPRYFFGFGSFQGVGCTLGVPRDEPLPLTVLGAEIAVILFVYELSFAVRDALANQSIVGVVPGGDVHGASAAAKSLLEE